jgi:glycerol-3-phosphate O-acyltransferase
LKYSSIKEILAHFEKDYPNKSWKLLEPFLFTIESASKKKKIPEQQFFAAIHQYCTLIAHQILHPCAFECHHKAIRAPIDYLKVGIDLFTPLIDFQNSELRGIENVRKIADYIAKGENVILFANHQIEADPLMLYFLLEKEFLPLTEKMTFVAGERVLTDPLAVPFSLGFHLFSVYSKKYFDSHPTRVTEMKEHNHKSVLVISQELNEGGTCLYIAPSGGRDRRNSSGLIEVAKFDPQSTELMYLLGRRSKKPTHFFPLAMSTHDILPPPTSLQIDLGEHRISQESPIYLHFGNELDMEHIPPSENSHIPKKEVRAHFIWKLVCDMYKQFPKT